VTISGAGGRLDVIDEIDPPAAAAAARRWIEPFLNSFGDVAMRIDELVAENDRVAARFRCSGTHLGTCSPAIGSAAPGDEKTRRGDSAGSASLPVRACGDSGR
jgi:hypothetical protein